MRSGLRGSGLRGAALSIVLLLLAGCAGEAQQSGPTTTASRAGSSPELTGTVNVFAAASLTEAFGQIAEDFQDENPDVTVVVSVGASSSLAQQIVAGAPADVFAAASPATMAVVTDAGAAEDPQVFVRNRLEIAVPPDNPGAVTGLADFAQADLTLALCAPQVPCGAAAAKVFEATGIEPAPDTLEQDVKAALSKVVLGEVDAALVYRTDVLAAGGEVSGIAFPEAEQAVNDYPLVALRAAQDPAAADAFVAYVLSPEGQQVLADAGFESP